MLSFRPLAAACLSLLIAAGCDRGEITAPQESPVGQVTVDASAAWVYVDLSTGAIVSLSDASTSSSWDIGFNALNVALNGGTAGPGGVVGYCVCTNATSTNDQVLLMTSENQADAFVNATSDQIPAATAPGWSSDVFATSAWYRYNLRGDHRISPVFNVYFIRRGSTVYKVQVTNYYNSAGAARHITVRYQRLRS